MDEVYSLKGNTAIPDAITQFYLDLKQFEYNIELDPMLFQMGGESYLKEAQWQVQQEMRDLINDYLSQCLQYKVVEANFIAPILKATVDIAHFNNEIIRMEIEQDYKYQLEELARKERAFFNDNLKLTKRLDNFNNLPWYKRMWKAIKEGV